MVADALEPRLKKLLPGSAKAVTGTTLDHFPDLIIYKCLSGGGGREALAAASQVAQTTEYETVSMPRRGYGPRPVGVLSPTARVRYTALASLLESALPSNSRARGRWSEHRNYGRKGSHSHVVDLDFASCYQFIDHQILCDELLLRTTDPSVVGALQTLLDRVARRGRGLPQMLEPSDRLADAYLEIVGRQLARQGWAHHRYADDFRVLADNWDTANAIIEDAATLANELGLILASHKTSIRLKATVDETERDVESFLDQYLEELEDSDSARGSGPYGDDSDEDEEDEDAAVANAYGELLRDWHASFTGGTERPLGMNSALPTALRHLWQIEEGVEHDVLLDLVFDDPLRMEYVCRYTTEHAAAHEIDHTQWALIDRLTAMGRQSPWAKLWLLSTIEALIDEGLEPTTPIESWIGAQLEDRHEIVRAQAAWVLASVQDLTLDKMRTLYGSCSSVSAAGLAAVAGLHGEKTGPLGQALKAIKDDSPLNQAAYAWAQSLIQTS